MLSTLITSLAAGFLFNWISRRLKVVEKALLLNLSSVNIWNECRIAHMVSLVGQVLFGVISGVLLVLYAVRS